MPYAFQHDESVPTAVRRVMLEQLVRARAELTDAHATHEKRVHEARKRFKEIRALLRLVRRPLGAQFAVENAWFRDAARELAAVRDADAVVEALGKLELPRAVRNGVRKQLTRSRVEVDVAALIERTVERLAVAEARVSLWPELDDGFDTLAAGLERTYRDGRRAMKQAVTPEQLHEWRKHVKTHWYHVLLLRQIWPAMMKAYAGTLEELSRAVGDHHDLHVLRESASEPPVELLAAIEARQRELEEAARELGARIYAERPAVFVARIEKLWRIWR